MDYVELNRVINESGLKRTAIAARLGLTADAFYRRSCGKTKWKAEEIVAMGEILGLTKRQRDIIFLP